MTIFCLICAVVPSILFPLVNFTYIVNETDPVTFNCSATGIPPPEITWMRNGVLLDDNVDPRISLGNLSDPEVFPTTGGNIYSVSRNLTISNTGDNDSDTYTCVGSNGNAVTPSVAQDFELIVQCKQVIKIVYPVRYERFNQSLSFPQWQPKSLTHRTMSQLLNLKMPLSPAWLLADPGQQLHGLEDQTLLYYNHNQEISL